jgi:hypothetical protein
MSTPQSFDYERFASLSGTDLIAYVEPFIDIRTNDIKDNFYLKLLDDLLSFDAEHLVYALELGMILHPCDFALRAARFLSSQDSSVCCTAFRVLSKLAPAAITEQLVNTAQSSPKIDLYFVHPHLGDSVHVGTNQHFVQELLAIFSEKKEKI